MKQLWKIIPIYVAALISLYLVVEAAKKSIKVSLYSFNNPPAVNNLVFNSMALWKYELDSVKDVKTMTYPDSSLKTTLYSLTDKPVLVFRFSGNMCSDCVDFIMNRISIFIPDIKHNNKVLFIYSDSNPALAEDYFLKKSYYISDPFHPKLDNLMNPYLCILDSDHQLKSLYVPDKAFPELLDKYLEIVRNKIE